MDDSEKELASSTLRSIALNYIHRTSPKPPKALLNALNRLKKRDDIIITKPDKGSGVVVMDKTEYIRLLSAASIDNTSKFVHVDEKRPKRRGRPAQHFHPLLQKEKELRTALRQILPEEIANSLSPKSSRLSHLYGLPKTHKATLSMRPFYQQLAPTITISPNGSKRNLSHSPSMTTQSLMPLLLLMKSVPFP